VLLLGRRQRLPLPLLCLLLGRVIGRGVVLLQPSSHTLLLLLLLLRRELCGAAPCCACDVKDIGVVPVV
jgi:hypothetical protein